MTLFLVIGIMGYKITIPEFDWYDSLLNASMILSGMRPVIAGKIILSRKVKVFVFLNSLFSGVATPIAHRFFHRLHLEYTK